MAMTILNNTSAMMALGEANKNNNRLSKSLNKVASGVKIGSAQDDASGYSISEKMRVQLRGLNQDIQNAQNGQSMLKTAEGAIASTINILRTMKEKAIDAANDTNTDLDRATIQKEINEFTDQIDDNAHITYNGKYMLNNATSVLNSETTDGTGSSSSSTQVATTTETVEGDDGSVEAAIIKALNSEWFQSCINLIDESFNMDFEESGTSVNEITVNLMTGGGNALASVGSSYSLGTGNTTKLTLNINMDYYSALDTSDVNGSTTTAGAGYLDRTLAHELTHAVMAVNITNFANLPKFIKEGMAEMVHGIDDERRYTILQLARNVTGETISYGTEVEKIGRDGLVETFANSTNGQVGELPYAGGYMWLHYLAKQSAAATGSSQQDVIKSFMKALDDYVATPPPTSIYSDENALIAWSRTQAQNALDAAVADCSGGRFANSAAVTTRFMDDFDANTDATYNSAANRAFLENYCGIILDNADTGSVTGSDMGGSTAKTAESIVPETGPTSSWVLPTTARTTFSGGLTAIWPSEYVGTIKVTVTWSTVTDNSDGTTGDENANRTWKPFYLQIGTKSSQAIAVRFADMRSTALGLRDDDGEPVSVATREKAQAAISVFDAALEKALDEQTNIGALQNRLEYTVSNLTTASENTQGSESTIRDADMAKAMSDYTKNNVLLQASQSMLAQANQNGSAVLSLLQ